MFLQNAKRKHMCGHCMNDIERGEVFCVQFIPREGNPKPWAAMYHYACWIPHMEKMLQKKYDNFAGKDIYRPPMKGRPRIPTTDRPLRRKLLSLRAFHAKRGNAVRVEEINLQIKALEVVDEAAVLLEEKSGKED